MHEISIQALIGLLNVSDPTSLEYTMAAIALFWVAVFFAIGGSLTRPSSMRKSVHVLSVTAVLGVGICVSVLVELEGRETVEEARANQAPRIADLCDIFLGGVSDGEIKALRQVDENRVVELCGRDRFVRATNSPDAEIRLASTGR